MIELRIKADTLDQLIEKVHDCLNDLEVAAEDDDLSDIPGYAWQLDL